MNVVLGDSETPTYLFHLARIYYQMGQKSEAAQTLARARKAGLKESELGLYERPLYEKLRDVLEIDGVATWGGPRSGRAEDLSLPSGPAGHVRGVAGRAADARSGPDDQRR